MCLRTQQLQPLVAEGDVTYGFITFDVSTLHSSYTPPQPSNLTGHQPTAQTNQKILNADKETMKTHMDAAILELEDLQGRVDDFLSHHSPEPNGFNRFLTDILDDFHSRHAAHLQVQLSLLAQATKYCMRLIQTSTNLLDPGLRQDLDTICKVHDIIHPRLTQLIYTHAILRY
jgi:hypothetical protein